MADNLVNLYWLGKCSAVRETTPVVTQRSREASDMPRTKKRKKDIARRGDHIVSLYCGSDSKHDSKHARIEEDRCFVANIRVLSLVHILNVLCVLPFVVG